MTTSFKKDALGDYIEKDAAAVLDYANDWTAWLAASATDTIATSTWTIQTGLTSSSPVVAAGVTSLFISGGTAGTTYTITNKIVTTGGRTDQRSFRVVVKDR